MNPDATSQGWTNDPFPHLVPGSWHAVLGAEPIQGGWLDWDGLVGASRGATMAGQTGPFRALAEKLAGLDEYVWIASTYGQGPPRPVPAPPQEATTDRGVKTPRSILH